LSVNALNIVAQQNVSSSEALASSSQQLSGQSTKLPELVHNSIMNDEQKGEVVVSETKQIHPVKKTQINSDFLSH
jgi:hypothetical protein